MRCQVCRDSRVGDVDRALADGKPLRDIGLEFGYTKDIVYRHKLHILDSLQTLARKATKASVKRVESQVVESHESKVSVFRDRLESTWKRIDRHLDKAERAVREVQVGEETAYIDASVTAVAPLINAAHRNLELLGKATGELSEASNAAGNITVNLVRVLQLPRAGLESRTELAGSEQPVIEAAIEPSES